MALKVTYSSPVFAKGEEVAVAGLGLLKNGQAVELDEEAERAYLAHSGMSVRDGLKDDPHFKIEGTAELKGSEAKPAEVSDTYEGKEVNE